MPGHNGWGATGGGRGVSKGAPFVLPLLTKDDVGYLAFAHEALKVSDRTGLALIDVLRSARTEGLIEGDEKALQSMAEHLAALRLSK